MVQMFLLFLSKIWYKTDNFCLISIFFIVSTIFYLLILGSIKEINLYRLNGSIKCPFLVDKRSVSNLVHYIRRSLSVTHVLSEHSAIAPEKIKFINILRLKVLFFFQTWFVYFNFQIGIRDIYIDSSLSDTV